MPAWQVHSGDAPVRSRDEHFERQELLDAEDDAVPAPDAEGEAAVVHSLTRVIHLEHLAVGAVGGGGQVGIPCRCRTYSPDLERAYRGNPKSDNDARAL